MMWKRFLVACAAIAVLGVASRPAAASAVVGPVVGVTVGDGGTTWWDLRYNTDGKTFKGAGDGTDFKWSMDGNTDPLVNWSFGVTAPGVYHVVFSIPVVGGPYNRLRNQAQGGVSDIGTTDPTFVTGVSIKGQVPTGTTIAAVTLTGDLTAPAGGFDGKFYGPATIIQNFGSPASMSVVLDFTVTDVENLSSTTFSGQLLLTNVPVPEPGTIGLAGLGGMALLVTLRRRRARA